MSDVQAADEHAGPMERDRKYDPIFAALAAPFHQNEVKVRTQAGRQLHYITARTAMNRLDEVIGPACWSDDYTPGEHSVLCRLQIQLPDGKIVVKCDAGGYAGMPDQGDDDKSGYSDGFKRAAAKFGVGRYLYRDGVPDFSNGNGQTHGDEDRRPATIERPPAPERSTRYDNQDADTPPERRQDAPASRGQSSWGGNGNGQQNGGGQRQSNGPPRSGRALFAWTKEQEQRTDIGLLKFLNAYIKMQDFPARMVDLDAEQVAIVHAEAVRKLKSQGAYEEALAN